MNAKDYESILDSLDATGIYVVREDNHEILYCNKIVKDMIPNAREGMICHELWQGSCSCCPLIGIEGKQTNHSFNYDGPGHKGTDITATRVTWDGGIPAFVVTFSPHKETYSSTYAKVVKGNLTTDGCVAVKMVEEERAKLPETFTLTMALESFAHGGLLYDEDIDRFLKFSAVPTMSAEFKSGKRYLVCNYRRNTKDGIHWNTMEVIPDDDYTDDNQTVMIYVKDVQDVYREGLGYEAMNLKTEAVLKALGGENFGIFLIDLSTGMTEIIKSDGKVDDAPGYGSKVWDDILKAAADNLYNPASTGKLLENFRLSALRGMGDSGKKKVEFLLERKVDGEMHYINAEAYSHIGAGDKKYAIVALRDVDAHMRKELSLIRDEKRMAEVIRSSYRMMCFPDLKTGRVEYVYTADAENDVSGSSDYEKNITEAAERLIYPADRTKFLDVMSLSSIREKAAKTTTHREEVVSYRTLEKGEIKWMEQHIFFMPGENGMDIAIFGRDVTAEKLREERENRTAREKAYIINGLNSMFLSMGYVDLKNGILRRVVQRGEVADKLGGGHDYKKVMTEYANKFVHPDDRHDYLETIRRENIMKALSDGHPVVFCEYRENSSDDEYRWLRVNLVLAETDGDTPSVALYVTQDITESKQKEEKDKAILQDALETANFANASKSEFLSRMSHDIRTPMNAIIGMTAIAGAHLDDRERVSDCLGKITVSGRHLLALINEVLDLSKIESGRVDLSEEEFTLATFFDELSSLVLPQIHAKEQSFECRMDNIIHEKVIGDSLRLQQVFMNILSNAVKYTPEHGKIEVTVQEKNSTISGYSYYEFTFKDNGIGMSEDYVKHIFEPFTREEKTRGGGSVEGTGLGMAIARNIVQMMNGDISVKSTPNVGSTFTVSLFLKICDSKDDEIEALAELPVLVADDDEDSCRATCHVLDEMGMRSEYVVSGKEAVVKVEAAHKAEDDYFAVILDWKMPGMDGIETARRIRAAVGPDVPIIILSAYDWADVEEEARAAGVNGFISKPLFRSRLAYLFRQFVENDEKSENGNTELSEMKRHDFSGKRVLLAEDNALNREIATEIIGMTGVEIECAINGREAVQLFEKSPEGYYDLIFMDIRMPVMDGHEATRTIRALKRPDAATIPIVAMSANAFASDIITSRQAGMNEHIIKPLNFNSLVSCMERWLGDKSGE